MVMKTLDRKLLRDLIYLKTPILSIGVIVALGLGTLFGFTSTYYSLEKARESFYQSHQFSDLIAHLQKAPLTLLESVSKIKNIKTVESRIVQEAMVSLPSYEEPILGRFISIPDGQQPQLNQLFLKSGRMPVPDSTFEVVISEAFANAHQLRPGSEVAATLNGRKTELVIVGVALSPEFIFAISGANPMPDDLHFGIFWMNHSFLSLAYDMKSFLNSLVIQAQPHSSIQQLKYDVDQVIKKYGALGATSRADQVSHSYISEEIKQLKVQATSVPLIFFVVAAFILNVVLSRLVSTQRSEIAALKALGFSDQEIGGYYFKLAATLILLGVILGLLLGLWIGYLMTNMYAQFYHFPKLVYEYSVMHFIGAVGVSWITALLGAFLSVRKIFKLSPAQAMRPPSPVEYHKIWMEKQSWFRALHVNAKMTWRSIFSTPLRSFSTGLGVSLAMLLLISGLFWTDSMDLLINAQYRFMQRETATAILSHPLPESAVYEINNMEGVDIAEGYRQIGIEVSFHSKKVKSLLLGMPSQAQLRKILDLNLKNALISEDGIYMSQGLARQLGVQSGDTVQIETLDDKQAKMDIKIHKVINSFMGNQIITSRQLISQLFHDDRWVNLVAFRSSGKNYSRLYTQLKEKPNVVGVFFKDSSLKMFEDTSAKYIIVFSLILALFAGIVGFGITYNNARIIYAERDWELATLEILGFKVNEIFSFVFSEIIILTLIFIPLGALFGYYYSQYLVTKMMPENFTIPFRVAPSTFAFAALTLVISTVFSGGLLYLRVRKLDIVATLKTRN